MSARDSGVADPRGSVVFRWLAAGDFDAFDAFDDLLHPDAVVHAPAGLSTKSAEAEKAVWKDTLTEFDGLIWPRGDGLSWPRLGG